MERDAQLASIEADGRRIGELTAAAPTGRVLSCPEWTGLDLRAHVMGFARRACDLIGAGGAERPTPAPIDPRTAATDYDAALTRLLATLRDTPEDAPAYVWSVTAPVAGFWVRWAVHELAVHRWDAETIGGTEPAPIRVDVAIDGIAMYFEAFLATALARGWVPPRECTLVLELTDLGRRLEHHLPSPGPVTAIRGTASDLMLALWRRHEPVRFRVAGDPTVLVEWPTM